MLFLKAVLLGIAVAAPLGPIGALCISRTLSSGFAAGFAGGVGTALADAAYAAMAAFGFAVALTGLGAQSSGETAALIRIVGGVLLIGLSLLTWRSARVGATPANASTGSLIATAATTFALTIANPATILSFAAMFAGLGLAEHPSFAAASTVVLGVFLGSLIWWAALSGLVAALRHRLPAQFGLWVGRGSALMLLALGLWAVFGH